MRLGSSAQRAVNAGCVRVPSQRIAAAVIVAIATAALLGSEAGIAQPAAGSSTPAVAAPATPADSAEGIAQYRALLAGDPAELWEAKARRSEQKRGPKAASLEACDLGRGPGVVKGAFVELPRYFAGQCRWTWNRAFSPACRRCRASMPRRSRRRQFGRGEQSNLESLVAYIAAASRSSLRAAAGPSRERRMYEIGKRVFFFGGGTHDFACASCHGEDGKRIRLQDLPNLTKNPGDGVGFWLARLPRIEGELGACMPAQRLLSPAALPVFRLRLGRDHRARRLHGRQQPGLGVRRADDEAVRTRAWRMIRFALVASIALAACATTPSPDALDAETRAVSTPRSASRASPARPHRAGPAAAGLLGPGDAAGRGDQAAGACRAGDDPVAAGRQLPRRCARARSSPRTAVDTGRIPPARRAGAIATTATSSRRPEDLVRHDRPEPLPVRQAAWRQQPARSGSGPRRPVHLGQALEQQGEHPAPRCRASARPVSSPRPRSAT